VDFVFCAVDMTKEETARLEEDYARRETPVVSNNSAHRGTPDVPMMIPEVNPEHAAIVEAQRRRLGTKRGFIAVKPNCSLQSYVPAVHPLMKFGPKKIAVCTYQAISGAGKTFESWPEMVDNLIPFIKGEEEKSEKEPMKIWGSMKDGRIVPAQEPVITAQCIRVPASDGHMAAAFVAFEKKPSREQILSEWKAFEGKPQKLGLPSAPRPFLTYFEDESRPQTRLDRDAGAGMAVTIGRLRPDALFDYRFVSLSHNTVRGAAGGAVLTAELLSAEGWIQAK
jgi:aspartate-semialdehyde dehydrogenase